jgi:hypothetical protein
MRLFELIGHHDHPYYSEEKSINTVIEKIEEIKNGDAKGVVVYGYMSGCPHCIRYDGVWSEACKKCPKGVFMYKVMMEDFPEESEVIGSPPRMFPTIYSYRKTPDGTIERKDHSHERDRIDDIVSDLSKIKSLDKKTKTKTKPKSVKKPRSKSKTVKKPRSKSKKQKKSRSKTRTSKKSVSK